MSRIEELKAQIADLILANKSSGSPVFWETYREDMLQIITSENNEETLLKILENVRVRVGEISTAKLFRRSNLMHCALMGDVGSLGDAAISEEEINAIDMCFNNTPVMWAAANGNNEFVYKFIEKFGNKIDFSVTALNNNLLTILIAKGYSNVTRDGKKFDHNYSFFNILQLIKSKIGGGKFAELINSNPDLRSGLEPLHLAFIRRDSELVKFLIESGADLTKPASQNEALKKLFDLGYEEASRLLSLQIEPNLLDKALYQSASIDFSTLNCSPRAAPQTIQFSSGGVPFIQMKFGGKTSDLESQAQKNLKQVIDAVIKSFSHIDAIAKKTHALLNTLGEFAEANPNLVGKDAGYSAWKNDVNFQKILMRNLRNSPEPINESLRKMMPIFSVISAALQKESSGKFDTIEGGHYSNKDLGARSFRLGMLYKHVKEASSSVNER